MKRPPLRRRSYVRETSEVPEHLIGYLIWQKGVSRPAAIFSARSMPEFKFNPMCEEAWAWHVVRRYFGFDTRYDMPGRFESAGIVIRIPEDFDEEVDFDAFREELLSRIPHLSEVEFV